MAQDDRSSGNGRSPSPSKDAAKLSDDITRVVNFLDTRRSATSERTTGLAQSVVQRREALNLASPRQPAPAANEARVESPIQETTVAAPPPADVASQPDQRGRAGIANPELSVRYHSFCSDLDHMLDSFRARVNSTKPVAH